MSTRAEELSLTRPKADRKGRPRDKGRKDHVIGF